MAIDVLSLPLKGSVDAGDFFHIVDNADSLDKRIVIDDIRDYVLDSPTETANFATLNIGGNPAPVNILEVYSAAADVAARIQTDKVNGIATLELKNDVQVWDIQNSAGDNLIIRDVTGGANPFIIENTTPTSTLYLDSTGHIGFGRVPTTDFDFYRASEDIEVHFQTDKVNGIVKLELENDAQEWQLRTHSDNLFRIQDATNGIVPFLIEPNTPTNSQYMQADGHVGWGRVPTTDFDFYRASEDIEVHFQTDKVNGVVKLELENDAQEWQLRTHSDNLFRIQDATNGTVPFLIEPNAPTNTLYLDSGGGLLAHTSTSLHPTLDTIESFGTFALIGRSSDNDTNAKDTRIGLTHYTNAEEPFLMVYGIVQATNNTVMIGGGHSSGNAATILSFYTAANNTTITGTERARFVSSGELLIGQTAVDGTGSLLQVAGDLSLRGASNVDRSLFFASDAFVLWDESADMLFASKSFISDPNVYHVLNDTHNNVFDAIAPAIPNTNDKVQLSGGWDNDSGIHVTIIASYAERTSATTIVLYGARHDTGDPISETITDGSGGTIDISVSWG